MKYLAPLFKSGSTDDLPATVDISHDDFIKYRDKWYLWRTLGQYDGNGSFVPPLSFMEAMQLPKTMLDTFFELDHFFERMKRQRAKKESGK